MKREVRQDCELCKGEVSVYCEADGAFLCWACDERVHGANFLAGRHVRAIACAGCRSFAAGAISGAGFAPIYSLCRACDPALVSSTVSCSSSCVSTAESASSEMVAAGKEVRWKRSRRRRQRIAMVIRVFGDYGGSVAEVPIRVSMAAKEWRKEREGGRVRACKRARAFLQADGNLARAALRGQSAKEGWDECP